jgi:hypothetical protein
MRVALARAICVQTYHQLQGKEKPQKQDEANPLFL